MSLFKQLFHRAPSHDSPLWWRLFFWGWNLGCVIVSSAAVGLLSLVLAPVADRVLLFQSYLDNPWILFLNIAPIVLLALFLYYLSGRATVTYWVSTIFIGLLSIINYFKLLFRNDPFIFDDVLLWKEAGNMAGKYIPYFTKPLVLCLLMMLLGGLCVHLFARGQLKGIGWYRIGGFIVCIAMMLPLSNQLWDSSTYNKKTANYDHINRWNSTEAFYSKGFIYPFIYSAKSAFPTPPENYNAKEAAALLNAYTSEDIPADQQVSVFSIMLEGYVDFTPYGIDGLSDDVYADYHALQAESYHGTMIANIFSGGTVDSERCYLTGYAHLPNFRSNTNSYPWYFREQGYSVLGAHPCYQWFYNRENVMEYLGFEDYWFVENHYTDETSGQVAYDDIFFPSLINLWEENQATGKPLFAYNLNYQGHGPYDSNSSSWGDDHVVSEKYSSESLNIMNNYFGMIQNTNQHLVELFDYFRQSDEPVIMMVFGDHKPWFGDGNSVYTELGMDFDMSTDEGFYDYYSTNYLIWANDAAKDTLGRDFIGEGPDVSANYLMNLVFQQAGWTGSSYLQATNDILERISVINTPTGQYLENGKLTTDLTPEGQALIDQFNQIEHYQKTNFAHREVD